MLARVDKSKIFRLNCNEDDKRLTGNFPLDNIKKKKKKTESEK